MLAAEPRSELQQPQGRSYAATVAGLFGDTAANGLDDDHTCIRLFLFRHATTRLIAFAHLDTADLAVW